ncbi:MAG TPA: LysR family transcriptional regulator [Candidimonas sp.]|nr:LysR family transcriptional regulator [Candidimonas sp.]
MKIAQSLDIKSLRVFEAVAATGNFSHAATELGLTQSAVSQIISQIEGILGIQVVDRSRRPIKLTPAGISLSRSAKQIVADMDRLIAQTREAALFNRVEVRLGMIDSFSATVGPHVLKSMVASTSRILAWSGLALTHASGLLNRQLDLIVSSDPSDDMDNLVRTKLYKESFLIVVPKEKEQRFAKLDLAQCAQEMPFIRFSARSHYGGMIERHLRRRSVSVPHYLEIDTADVVMAMVASGLGWAIASPLCVAQGMAVWDNIAVLPLPGPVLSRTIYLISRSGENEDPAEEIYRSSRAALEEHVLPTLQKKIPWLKTSHNID